MVKSLVVRQKTTDVSAKYVTLLFACLMPVSYPAYHSILKMEAAQFPVTPVDFQPNARRHFPKDRHFNFQFNLLYS
jgi:hypothetical protein